MLEAAKPRLASEKIAIAPRIAAGVPWKSEIKQLENSVRILGFLLRKMMK